MSDKKNIERIGPSIDGIENVYRKMIEEVEDYAIILLDLQGNILNWNAGAQNIKGYTAAEILGRNFSLFYQEEDRRSGLPEKLIGLASEHGKATHEGWRVRKDGSRFWGSIVIAALHNEQNEIIGFTKVTRDLTERKEADDKLRLGSEQLRIGNEELRKSEERYHKMIAEVQDYAIILLSPEGNIQNWNAGAEKIKGYTAKEIVGKNLREFYLEEDRIAQLPENLIRLAAEKGKATHEGWRMRKDRSRFWGSVVITALHNDDGDVIGFSKVTRDLTERKLAEDQLQQYLRELEAQNRELERFAYIASHDLQEPLRKIRTFIDIIRANFDNKEMVNNYFNKINTSAQRMSDLIRSILSYSKLGNDADQKDRVDLNLILNAVREDFELVIADKKAVFTSAPLPGVKGNALQINQVFANIIANALKFSSKAPEIDISSKITSAEQPGSNNGKKEYIEVIIADNGIGFEPQYKEQIFTLFQRLHGKHEYDGTGIGLALCKRIMENHGGFISATGEPGKGSRFSLYFPLLADI